MRQISPPGSHHDEQEIEAIVELLRSSRLMIGENVAAFEEQVAPLMAKRHGVMVNSGTSAIYLALDLLGPGAGTHGRDIDNAHVDAWIVLVAHVGDGQVSQEEYHHHDKVYQ